MPASRFWADQFCKDPLFRLTKTTRPYFLQSRTLVLACRQLPEPPSGAAAQIEALRKLFREVEDVLKLGTTAHRNHQKKETNDRFEAAYKQLCDYIKGYTYMMPAPYTEEVKDQPCYEVREKDRKAASLIKEIGALAGNKLKSWKRKAKLTLSVTLWPEIPRKRENGKWEYASCTLAVEIEESTSLNVLLHKLFWAKAIDNALASFSLKQNPEFYLKFPNAKEDFRVAKSRSDIHPYIPALYVWDPVEKYKDGTLHLIVDRDTSGREVELEDLTKLHLPGIYGNGWYLVDDKYLIAVREKGRLHKLLLWNVKQPAMPSVDDSSTLTLVEVPGVIPGLSIERLDEEWESFRKTRQFDRHYTPPSSPMQTVDPDAPVKKIRIRRWLERFL